MYCSRQCYFHKPAKTLAQRFWKHVDKSGECWTWTGGKTKNGYGVCGGRDVYKMDGAHRISWQLHFGEIPTGMVICHKCDNPPCVRPEHLFLGTHTDNITDAIKKGRHKAPDGRGEGNGSAKLTKQDVLKIRTMKDRVGAHIAREYAVTPEAIYAIRKGKTWSHI